MDNRKPLITVILPIGSQDSKFLFRVGTSLIDQSYKNIELIVSDYSQSIAEGKFDNAPVKVRHIRLDRGKNLADAVNIAARRSKGGYLVICNANGFYYPDFIESLYRGIKDGKADIAYSYYDQIDTKKGGLKVIKPPELKDINIEKDRDLEPRGIMIKRSCFAWFDNKIKSFYNWDLIIKIIKNKRKGALIRRSLFDHYYNPISYDVTQSHFNAVMMKYRKILTERFKGVAVLIENQSNYSGGRYHSWQHAIMLAEAGIPVKIFTNKLPVFKDDFIFYKQPEIELVSDLGLVDVDADLYYCSPFYGSVVGIKLAKRYRRRVICQIFDPQPWLEKLVPKSELGKEILAPRSLLENIKKMKMQSRVMFSVSTNNAVTGVARWFGVPKEKVLVLPPYVNGRASLLPNVPKRKWVMSISRSVARKSWGETLEVFKRSKLYEKDYRLQIITDDPTEIERKANEMGVGQYIDFHSAISDLEKFYIMYSSQAILSTSRFEGYGMWVIEGCHTDVPVICYDLPPMEEIKKNAGEYSRIYLSKIGDIKGLADYLIASVREESPYIEPVDFTMDGNLGLLKERMGL